LQSRPSSLESSASFPRAFPLLAPPDFSVERQVLASCQARLMKGSEAHLAFPFVDQPRYLVSALKFAGSASPHPSQRLHRLPSFSSERLDQLSEMLSAYFFYHRVSFYLTGLYRLSPRFTVFAFPKSSLQFERGPTSARSHQLSLGQSFREPFTPVRVRPVMFSVRSDAPF